MDVNMHIFPYFALKCIGMLHGKAAALAVDIGAVIEGRADDELPEVLLGGGRFTKIDYFGPETQDLSALRCNALEEAKKAALNSTTDSYS